MSDIGKAYIQIEPTAKGITKSIESELGNAGVSGGASFSKGFASVLGKGGKAMAGIAVAGAGAIAGLTSAFVNGASNVAEYGDNIDKMSQKMGMSAESYQEWDAVMQHSGTSMETMKASMKTLAGAVETGKDAFDALGLSQEQLASMSQEEIFEATIAGLQNVEDTTTRTYLAGQLLGRGATELGALLNTSAEETQAMRDRVRELGGVMSGDAVKASAQFQDQLQDMQTAFSGISRNLLSQFLPSLTQVMSGLTEIFSGNDGLGQITEGINGIVDGITQHLPEVAKVATEIIKALADALIKNLPMIMQTGLDIILELVDAIVENLPMLVEIGMQIVVQLLEGIAEALPDLIPAIVEMIAKIVEVFFDNLPLIIEAGIQIILGLIQGLVQAIPILIQHLPTIITSIVNALITALPLLIEGTIQLVMGIVQALPTIIQALVDAIPQIIETLITGLLTALPMLIAGLIQLNLELVAHLPEIIVGLIEAIPQIIEGIVNAIITCAPMFADAVTQIIDSISALMQQYFPNLLTNISTNMQQIVTNVETFLKQLPAKVAYWIGEMIAKFINLLVTLPSKIQKIWTDIINALKNFGQKFITEGPNMAKQFGERLIAGLKELPSKMLEIGHNIVEGLKSGISNAWNGLTGWVKDLADNLVKGFKDNLKIGSPSKLMADEVGVWIPAGIAEGIKEGMPVLNDSMAGLAIPDVAGVSPYAPAPVQSTQDSLYSLLAQYLPIIASGENVHITMNVDNDRLFRIIQTEQRRNIQLVGVGNA